MNSFIACSTANLAATHGPVAQVEMLDNNSITPLFEATVQATEEAVPHAAVCFDPFHVSRLANRALESVYSASRFGTDEKITRREWMRTRYALRAGAERLGEEHLELLRALRRSRYRVWRAWELKELLRDFFRIVEPAHARAYLKAWCTSALRSRLRPFVVLAGQIRRHFEGIVATVEWGLSNSRLEGINAKIRLINRRGFGHHSPQSLASMIYLCLGGITVPLPTGR